MRFSSLLLGLLAIATSTAATKLNYPRVLLPIFEQISVNFTLEVVEKGCFKWTSSRLDLIQLKPISDGSNDDCSYQVVVSVIDREHRRSTAIVWAEDLATGEILRCDVILDVIDQLGVLTTTRELYLEEAPETFELWALDAQGNAFTTLEGIEFTWRIVSHRSAELQPRDWNQVLTFLAFSESSFHTVPKAVAKLEAAGLQGSMILLVGVNTGSARVTATLPYVDYVHVPSVEVDIMVLANLILSPSDVYIMPGDTVNFKVLQLKQGKLHEISLNSQYYLESEDSGLATIKGNVAKGLKQGRTSVLLRDHNVPHDRNSEDPGVNELLPKAFITIAEPKRLSLSLLPHHNWVTVEGESHEIALDLFTADDHQITVGPKYSIQSAFDETLFYPLRRTNNGSRIEGETVASGSSPVTGTFDGLTAKADLIVLKRLTIDPPEVIIPYDPSLRRQKAQFTATGGDGCFMWSSMDKSLVAIGQTGLAEMRLDSLKDGIVFGSGADEAPAKVVQIRAALTLNSKIFVDAHVIFLPPIKLEIVRYNIETVVKDYVQVHVALWARVNGTMKAFTSCENLNFELEFSSQIFLLDSTKNSAADVLADKACRVLHLKATTVGQTSLKVNYRYFDKVLSDHVSLNVFEELAILNPIENEVVLPIGASRNMIYENGPEKIYNSEAELQKRLVFDSKNLAVDQIEGGFSKDKHILRVLCKKIGNFDLKLEVFNTLNAPNVVPYVTEIVTKVYCVKPRFVNLFATDKVKTSCPLGRRNSMMHVKSDNDDHLVVDIEVLDVQNRKLANISSLLLEWQFTLADREQVLNQASYEQKTETDLFEGVEIPRRDFLRTKVPDVKDNFKIKTTVTQYRSEVLKAYSIKPESPHFGVQKAAREPMVKPVIENELNFLSVNKTLLPYEHITLFLARSNVERIRIAQGSGFYDMKVSDSGIVSMDYDGVTRQLAITPKRAGEVKLEIVDQCLSTESSYLHISVVTIGRITLHAPDRVEKTKSIDAIARIYDSNDRLLELQSNNLEIYELSHNVNNPNLLSMALGSQLGLAMGEIRYTVTGMELGDTKIVVNSGSGEKQISSAPVPIQVFPPLTLFPRNATIIVGSFLQVYSKGGPSPDTNIVYSVQHNEIISIESGVAYGLKIGRSKITGRCVGTSPTTGAQIVFSEDTIYIHVIPLDAVEIKTPLNRIRSGAVMPAHVWGVPNISPMVLGTLDMVKIYWSTDHEDVLDVRGVFQEAGIQYTEKDAIGVRVKTLAPGKANLYVTLVTASGQKLTARSEITVFRVLELESPKVIRYDSILVPPRSSVQLKSNLDDTVFQLEEGSTSMVKISKEGLLKSEDALGRVQIVASSFDQSLTIPAEVKNIHYILTSLEASNVKLRHPDRVIPQGINIRLKVSFHDNLGNEFSNGIEEIGALKHKLSTKGNVLITSGANYSLGLELIRETSDMLLISLKDKTGVKYGDDYIKLVVGKPSTVFLDETVFSVGDIICFESPLLGSISDWHSSDNNLVRIHPVRGVAHVVSSRRGSTGGDGKVYISHGDRRSGGLHFAIDVLEADEIGFIRTYDVFNGEKYRAHLVLKNHLQVTKLANVIGQNVSTCSEFVGHTLSDLFSCKLLPKQDSTSSILKHFKAVPSFDPAIGAYTCDVETVTSIEEIANLVKSSDVTIELEARLSGGSSSDSMTMKIVPAFIVEPDAISIEQIGSQAITVSGIDSVLKGLEIKSSNPSVLEVSMSQKDLGSAQYQLRLLKSYSVDSSEELFVSVISKLTQQNVKVPVQSPLVMRKCASQPFYSMPNMFLNYVSQFGLMISALIVLAATVWVFVFCFPQRQKTADPNATLIYSPFKSDNTLSSYNNATRLNGSPFVSPMDKRTGAHMAPLSPYGGAGNLSHNTTPLSPSDFNASSSGSPGSGSPIYGDSTLMSPQKRIHRRQL
ncbi:nuclear pore membrane glycoprotein 210 [Toxorhynchites rutilus septentrionalis]|uniref:nuclear pore membrane glycoprotein 210 n=1 Tax=Toxorhynchites rutilus septentrionalis TaxID=329112 RepID=UPI002478DC2F|nr:nuclear pore membrane glycoprotein 210 [Toxorhynchites rutilus septentrionalis]